MLASEIRTLARRLANTNSTVYSDADVLIDLNIVYGGRVLDIINISTDRNSSQTEVTLTLTSTSGLVAGNNGFNGEYAFPTDLIRPVRVEISYDAITWRPASFYDIYESSVSEHEEDAIQGQFSESEPYVRFDRDSFFIRPLKTTSGNVTAGIHIWYEKRQTALTASDTPDIESNLHTLLAYDCANMFATQHPELVDNNHFSRILTEKSVWEDKFFTHYKNRFKRDMNIKPNYPSYA